MVVIVTIRLTVSLVFVLLTFASLIVQLFNFMVHIMILATALLEKNVSLIIA